jgi:hypothetical protein
VILNTFFGAIFLVLAGGALGVLGLLATRKLIHIDKLKPTHDVGGYLLAVVGTLYAVLLGLIVVDAMQQYQHAREVTQHEANNLADVYLLSKGLNEPAKSTIQNMCVSYSDQVASTEWKQMCTSQSCPVARTKAFELMTVLLDFEPKTEKEKAIYPQLVQEASAFWQNRQERLSIAEKTVPIAEWTLLIAGAMITLVFTFFFGLENLALQLVMTALVGMLMSINLTMLLLFAYPFSGDMAVQSKPFKDLSNIVHG